MVIAEKPLLNQLRIFCDADPGLLDLRVRDARKVHLSNLTPTLSGSDIVFAVGIAVVRLDEFLTQVGIRPFLQMFSEKIGLKAAA